MFEGIKKLVKRVLVEGKPRPIHKDEMIEKLIEGTDLFITKKRWAYKQLKILKRFPDMSVLALSRKVKLPEAVVQKYRDLIEEGWSVEVEE